MDKTNQIEKGRGPLTYWNGWRPQLSVDTPVPFRYVFDIRKRVFILKRRPFSKEERWEP